MLNLKSKSLFGLPEVILAVFLSIIFAGSAFAVDYPLSIQRGNGLANFFTKLRNGQNVKVIFIGGSVTEGSGYRDNVTSWLNSQYPGKITSINKGWSGTGSLVGALRFNRDILANNPDLVFIEFAVNDLPEDPIAFIQSNCEGMVRQAWYQNPNTDVCFLQGIAYYNEAAYLSGSYPNSVQAQNDVGDRYGVPSVNMGWALYQHVQAGTSWESLTLNGGDRVHPNSTGSQYYADAVDNYLLSEKNRSSTAADHTIPTALNSYPVTGSTITDMTTVSPLPSGWSAQSNQFGVSTYVQSSNVGSTISINFTNTSAVAKIIADASSTGADGLAYSIDGGAYQPANISVPNGYFYLWGFPIAKNISNGTHTVRFKINAGTARIISVEASTSSGGNSSDGMNSNTPTGTNLARTAVSWQTDSDFSADYNGSKAIDGVISGTSKWCTANIVAPHWLALDLGANRTVNGYIVRLAGAGGEEAYYNAKNFKIQTATSMSEPWTDETTVDNSAQVSIIPRSYNTPKSARYLRLYITNAGIDNYARIPEFEVLGSYIAPSTPTVTDDGVFTINTAQLHATWTSSDAPSSIAEYQYAIGTTSGGTDIVNWTSAGTTSSVTKTGLSLTYSTTYYISVKAKNGVGLWSSIGTNDGITIAQSISSIAQAKGYADDSAIQLVDKIVSAKVGTASWIEESDRSSGIKVNSSLSANLGDKVTVTGKLLTVAGERSLEQSVASQTGTATVLKPVSLRNGALGGTDLSLNAPGVKNGTGTNNIGLLVNVWGKGTQIGTDYFYVNDGAGLLDGSNTTGTANVGIRILTAPGTLNAGDFVIVTGISSTFDLSSQHIRAVLPISGGVTKI